MFTRATSTGSSSRIDSTALHGRHQGAQKSTATGASEPRTTSSKSSPVTSRIAANLQAAAERARPQPRHLPDRLEDDPTAHLRFAGGAVDEADGHLDDAEPLAESPVRRLDLEDVAGGVDRLQVDRLE